MTKHTRRILALKRLHRAVRKRRAYDKRMTAGPTRQQLMARLSDEEWLIWSGLSREAAIEVGVGDRASAVARLVRDEQVGVYGKDRRTA